MDEALFNCSGYGPTFDCDLLTCVKDDDSSRDYNSNKCKQRSYEKKIRDAGKFLMEDYEVFQIIKE